jgi:hypothetical protein
MRKATLPPQVRAELAEKIATYERLKGDDDQVGREADRHRGTDAQVQAISRKGVDKCWWPDLKDVELAVVRRSDAGAIRSSLPGWRRRLREVIGENRYGTYAANALDPTCADEEDARNDLDQCISTVYYFYEAYGLAALSRNGVTSWLLGYAAVIILVLASAMFFAPRLPALTLGSTALTAAAQSPASSSATAELPPVVPTTQSPAGKLVLQIDLLLATAIAGVLGSVVSVQARLQDPKVDVDPFYRYIQTSADRFSIALFSPLSGALFAMFAFGAITGGVINSDLFTAFSAQKNSSTEVAFASFMILGFVTGFAERLVPDTLTRIAGQALGAVIPFSPAAASTEKATASGGRNGTSRSMTSFDAPSSNSVVRTYRKAETQRGTIEVIVSGDNGTDVTAGVHVTHPDV